MKTKVVAIAMMVMASGCATKMGVQQQEVMLAGKTFHYVVVDAKDPAGVNFVVLDRYDSDGKLMIRDSASGNGILHAVIPAVIDGAATAGGLIGAAAVLRPDTTNVTQTSSGATDSNSITVAPNVTSTSSSAPVTTSAAISTSNSSSNSAATSASKSASASTSSATAKQSQAQVQGQAQLQGQTQQQTSPVKRKYKTKGNGGSSCER